MSGLKNVLLIGGALALNACLAAASVPCGETNACDNLSFAAAYYIAATAPYETPDCGTYDPAEQLQSGEILNSALEQAGIDSRRLASSLDDSVLMRPLHLVGCRALTSTRNTVINGVAQSEIVHRRTFHANGLTETLSQFTNGSTDQIDDVVVIDPATGLMTYRTTSCPNTNVGHVIVEIRYDSRRRVSIFRTVQPEFCFNAATTSTSTYVTTEYRDSDALPDRITFASRVVDSDVSDITVNATVDFAYTRDAWNRVTASAKQNSFDVSIFVVSTSSTVASSDSESWNFAYSYEDSGLLASQSISRFVNSTGITTTGDVVFEYADGGRVKKISAVSSNGTSLTDSYTYNSDGNVTRRDVSGESTGTVSSATVTYTY